MPTNPGSKHNWFYLGIWLFLTIVLESYHFNAIILLNTLKMISIKCNGNLYNVNLQTYSRWPPQWMQSTGSPHWPVVFIGLPCQNATPKMFGAKGQIHCCIKLNIVCKSQCYPGCNSGINTGFSNWFLDTREFEKLCFRSQPRNIAFCHLSCIYTVRNVMAVLFCPIIR